MSDNVDSQSVARHFTSSSSFVPQVEEEVKKKKVGRKVEQTHFARRQQLQKQPEKKKEVSYISFFFFRADGRAQGTAMCVRRWGGCINDVAMERHQSRRDGSGCV